MCDPQLNSAGGSEEEHGRRRGCQGWVSCSLVHLLLPGVRYKKILIKHRLFNIGLPASNQELKRYSQQLKALTAPAEDLGSIPSTHLAVYNYL